MPTLFLVDGAAGSGKTDFIQHFCEQSNNDAFVKKYTTKIEDDGAKRPDLDYKKEDDYKALLKGKKQNVDYFEYHYPEEDKNCRYMVLKDDIDKELRTHNNVYLIIRNDKIISKIKSVYASYLNIKIVTMFIYSDSARLEKRVEQQCRDKQMREAGCIDETKIKEEIQKRLNRNAECLKSYISTIGKNLYDYVILNDISYDEYHRCMKEIKQQCEEDNINKFTELNAFIIMPITEGREWMHFNEVKNAIIQGAKMQGFIAERQDDKNDPKIMDSIKESINDALVCIVDLTLSRPNCYYELGLAEETHRTEQIVILKQENEKLAFDLQGRKCSDYTFHENDYSRISNIVSQKLAQFRKNHIFMTNDLEEYINRIKDSDI